MFANSFEDHPAGRVVDFEDASGRWQVTAGNVRIQDGSRRSGTRSLRLDDDRSELLWTPAPVADEPYELTFWTERWSAQGQFGFSVEAFDGEQWKTLYNGDEEITIGGFNTKVTIPLYGVMPKQFRFTCISEPNRGILIDDLRVTRSMAMTVQAVAAEATGMPVLIGNRYNPVQRITIEAPGSTDALNLQSMTLSLNTAGDVGLIETVEVYATDDNRTVSYREPDALFERAARFGSPQPASQTMTFSAEHPLADGNNYFWVSYALKPDALPNADLPTIVCESVTIGGQQITVEQASSDAPSFRASQRVGVALRNSGDDGVTSYRIPGLATTNSGALIAVYDVRYDGWGDLPANVDIGMSRSTDGGLTWEPMKIIADMGDDPKWSYDGVGDPAVLVDSNTGTIWVAGLWSHGERGWRGSGPGLSPEETGQFLLFKSDDDGVTWSEPINITKQVKQPQWHLMFQGPGNGITMLDGALVFPAQFKDAQDLPHSTIITSQDHGKTWQCGTGAEPNTTEAQVVELADGSLMLNMRDNRGGARSVCVTKDLGKTWTEHESSRSALPEPVCQASIIRVDVEGYDEPVLLFSNPAVPDKPRRHMTIKASFDGGRTWPAEHHLLIDAGESAGYSCLTMIDNQTVGILYEGSRANMTFQRILLAEIMGRAAK